jgi:hypothetical protein
MLNEKEYKVMKRIYLIFISLGIVMLSACSTGDSSSSGGNDNSSGSKLLMSGTLDDTRVIETDAGAGVNTSSMTTSWAKTDEMVVVYNAGTSASPSYNNATFKTTSGANGFFQSTGSFTQAQINGYINNPAIAMNTTNATTDTITTTQSSTSYKLASTVTLLGSQDGTLGNVSHYDLIYASSTSNGVSQKPFDFKHAMCVIRIDICNLPVAATYVKSATITYTPTGSTPQILATSASYTYDGTTLTNGSVASATSITMTCPTGGSGVAAVNQVGVSNGKASIYLVVPGSTTANAYSGKLAISITDNNNITSGGSNVLLSNKTLNPGSLYAKTVAMIRPGMYYFSDGTWGILAENPSKTPIAVIFYTTPSTIDYGLGRTHGYAMALKNSATKVNWGPRGTETPLSNSFDPNYTLLITDMDGYTNTKKIKDTYGPLSASNYPAFYYALNYPVAAPSTSSGWYLPSSGQWYWIAIALTNLYNGGDYTSHGTVTTTNSYDGSGTAYQWTRATTSPSTATYINNYLSPVGGDLFVTTSGADFWLWDSTESTKYSGGAFEMKSATYTLLHRLVKDTGSSSAYGGYVRPVIAF